MTEVPEPKISLGIWEHHSGKQYLVLGIGVERESRKRHVIYAPLTHDPELVAGEMWLHTPGEWLEVVDKEGGKVPRFRYLTPGVEQRPAERSTKR